MSLILCIETSSDRFSVVFGRGGRVLFDSSLDPLQAVSKDLPYLVGCGLTATGQRLDEIGIIAVDVGPGNLGSVRTGVAFANGLAFSLNKPLCALNAFELIGHDAAQQGDVPILCIRKASAGNVFAAWYAGGVVTRMRFGPLAATVQALATHAGAQRFAVAGAFRADIAALLPAASISDSGIEIPQARTMLQLDLGGPARAASLSAQISPLNDQSPIFYEPILVMENAA